VVSRPGRHQAEHAGGTARPQAAGPVAEVTESLDGVVVVQRASARWRVRVCCRAARRESDGYPARRADLCIQALFFLLFHL
jgi:hypothetical protein